MSHLLEGLRFVDEQEGAWRVLFGGHCNTMLPCYILKSRIPFLAAWAQTPIEKKKADIWIFRRRLNSDFNI